MRRALSIVVLAMIPLAGYVGFLVHDTPTVQQLRDVRTAQPTIVLAAGGAQLGAFRRTQQQLVDLQHISPHVVKALLATEDHRFYAHHGIDFVRLVSAFWYTVRGDLQG